MELYYFYEVESEVYCLVIRLFICFIADAAKNLRNTRIIFHFIR